MAGFLTQRPNLPLAREFVERFAHRWMEYSLFAKHVATGDSLLDSATIVEANWPDIYQSITYLHHLRLVEERIDLDSAALDSAYHAGEPRIVHHILIRKRQDMTPAEEATAKGRAERVRARLARGASWAEMNEQFNDDVAARGQGGSIGVLWRGQTVPEFDSVAYALAPGELSQVVETIFGFHIVRRPTLADVREAFHAEVENYLIRQMDSLYLVALEERRKVQVRGNAAALAREAVNVPLQSLESRKVLGSYDKGTFTVADLIRWLQALPPQVHQQALNATDEQLEKFVRSLIRNDIVAAEARRAGVDVAEEDFAFYRDRYTALLSQLRDRLGIDSALAKARNELERARFLEGGVDRYMELIARTQDDIIIVPPFLASILRRKHKWKVSPAGVDRAVARAEVIRAAQARAAEGAVEPQAPDTVER